MPYKTIGDLQQAIERGEIKITDLSGFNCKRELFINDRAGRTIFNAYYGTDKACEDVCTLLGIDLQEV